MPKITPEEREILDTALGVESAMDEVSAKLGWSWQDIRTWPATINKLIVKGLVREAFHSNSSTGYLVTEEARLALQAIQEASILEPEVIDTSHLFEPIVGYEAIKELLTTSLSLDKPVHVLLYGPPAIAKSMFLWEIEKVFGRQALPLIGSATSRAGMWDLIAERKPKIILIDELEKMNLIDMTALLSLMEYGRLIRAKVGREVDLQLTCWVFATANRINTIPPELLSRFAKQRLRQYTAQEYVEVVKVVLQRNEQCTLEEATLIADQLVGKTQDIRDAIRVARIARLRGVPRAIDLALGQETTTENDLH
jgi:holliday junction DNA helicase RuvB